MALLTACRFEIWFHGPLTTSQLKDDSQEHSCLSMGLHCNISTGYGEGGYSCSRTCRDCAVAIPRLYFNFYNTGLRAGGVVASDRNFRSEGWGFKCKFCPNGFFYSKNVFAQYFVVSNGEGKHYEGYGMFFHHRSQGPSHGRHTSSWSLT